MLLSSVPIASPSVDPELQMLGTQWVQSLCVPPMWPRVSGASPTPLSFKGH